MEYGMYRVTGYWRNNKVSRIFIDVYDAIEFKDIVDANYPLKVTFEKGVYPMRSFIVNSWNAVMNSDYNPLSAIPHTGTRHMVMQVLAWMWVIVFTISTGTWAYVGINFIAHSLILGAIVITVGTFETARRKPEYFGGLGRGNGGEHE
jgi:hypothetical protein|tara:strand:+ start:112 stop:555 length:444 start_codon:yes stop_codon:yes gene_type:complete